MLPVVFITQRIYLMYDIKTFYFNLPDAGNGRITGNKTGIIVDIAAKVIYQLITG